MKRIFKREERISLGVDIGTDSIKYLKLRFANKGAVELSGFGLEHLGGDLVSIIRKIKQSQEVNYAAISFSGPSTVIRHVNFPRMNENELRQALKFEAQKHIPFSVEEVNLDACILKGELPENKMLVLIAAVKKDFISQRLDIFADAGIRATAADIDSLALSNAFNFNYPQEENQKYKALALLNIGASMANLNILENGLPLLSRDIHIAGNNFTQKLVDVFGLDFKSAEQLKINPDAERSKSVSAAVETVFANLAVSVRTSFDYYESQSATSVSKIFLSGGGAKFSGLKDMLVNLLGIEVEYWDPFKNVRLPEGADSEKIKSLSTQLAVALGLALR